MYGLPKIHKVDVPLRPIASFVQSPTYQLSKHLSTLLSPLVGNSSSAVKNSKEFATFIREQTLQSDEVLVSFDVKSLFTNVPTSLAIDVAHRRLLSDDSLDERTALDVDEIIVLLKLCLDATYVCFRGKYYQQTFGTAMGSPVSVVVANLVMEEVEQKALATFTFAPRFWKRYVDDTCTALSKQVIPSFHQHINSVNDHIQFTLEEENGGRLAFLDLLLKHNQDGTVDTTVYRKKTHTDKYLDFTSHHPLVHKQSVVTTLFERAENLCSDARSRAEEELHIRSALNMNGYPKRFVKCVSQRSRVKDKGGVEEKTVATVSLPYVGGVSENIKRLLEQVGIRVRMKPQKTLRQMLVKPKDQIPNHQQTGVIYRVPCRDCQQAYVGQSGRTLDCRIKEHKRAVQNRNIDTSAVAEHAWKEDHKVDWGQVEILDVSAEWYKRCVIESWHIQREQAAMNRDQGVMPQVYRTLQ